MSVEDAQTSWGEVSSLRGKREGFVRHVVVQGESHACKNSGEPGARTSWVLEEYKQVFERSQMGCKELRDIV